jgi:site-specific DNA-methyltransferase (adenine-specific)
MSTVTLYHGDNREHLRRLIGQGVRVHSVVCDPPYGLVSTTKRFGKKDSAPAKFGTDGAFARASAGFMGSAWDGTGIERDPEFWKLIHDILLPGGYVMAFSSPRTGHWQAVAMELAGFIMHPFQVWAYGQGFPKAHSAAKAIDATLISGKMRTEDMRRLAMGEDYEPSGRGRVNYDHGAGSNMNGATGPYEPKTEEAEQWNGWAYGGQALKPAIEPIYVGQKPFSERNGALNILKHGVGAINIDGCRVGDDRGGRHPANLLHDGSPEVVAMFPQTSSGTGAVKRKSAADQDGNQGACYGAESRPAGTPNIEYGDSGSAARFFNSFPLDADPILYHGKATKADRAGSSHPTVKPITLMQWLCRLVTPPGGTVLDPFAGSGTTGQAAMNEGFDCILMEAEDAFADDIRKRFTLADSCADLPRELRSILGIARKNVDEPVTGFNFLWISLFFS